MKQLVTGKILTDKINISIVNCSVIDTEKALLFNQNTAGDVDIAIYTRDGLPFKQLITKFPSLEINGFWISLDKLDGFNITTPNGDPKFLNAVKEARHRSASPVAFYVSFHCTLGVEPSHFEIMVPADSAIHIQLILENPIEIEL